jgi:hypothetical protein
MSQGVQVSASKFHQHLQNRKIINETNLFARSRPAAQVCSYASQRNMFVRDKGRELVAMVTRKQTLFSIRIFERELEYYIGAFAHRQSPSPESAYSHTMWEITIGK